MYLRPNTHTLFVKYSEDRKSATIPLWFYEWWSQFGVNKHVLSPQFLIQFEKLQVEQNISTLQENIKWCKLFISKRISYIIIWSFDIYEIERIKYPSKTIKIKG